MERREFVSAIAALGALTPLVSEATQQRPEVPNYWAEVPPGSSLWALAVFLGEDPVEFTVGAGKDVKTIRGQFDAQRLKEYSWRNNTGSQQRVAVRARALAGDRELPPTKWSSSASSTCTSPSAHEELHGRHPTATVRTPTKLSLSASSHLASSRAQPLGL